jgi:hypothetical protein
MTPNPNSRRNNGIPVYMSPELKQSIRNLSAWFGCSQNEMLNRLLRLGMQNAEFMVEADRRKRIYKHEKTWELLNMDSDTQKTTQRINKFRRFLDDKPGAL